MYVIHSPFVHCIVRLTECLAVQEQLKVSQLAITDLEEQKAAAKVIHHSRCFLPISPVLCLVAHSLSLVFHFPSSIHVPEPVLPFLVADK